MPNKAYNYDFKMFMEGIAVPFKSVQIMCTPNGVEASINLLSNREVFDLKPKTAVQIFYRDWVSIDNKRSWRLMFDGFLSSYVKNDESLQGRGLAILCRDFRMDIRKTPAALVYQGVEELGVRTLYHTAGIMQKWIVRGYTPKSKDPSKVQKGSDIKTYGTSGLQDLGAVVGRIVASAYGIVGQKKSGEYIYASKENGKSVYSNKFGKGISKNPKGKAECSTFLDAIVRGIWTEAVGGTSVATFINKRIRVDKRFLIPANETGYNFWSRQTAGLNAGSVVMGNSKFSSIEAAIMRLAGLFSVRCYSCNTPSLISLESSALRWVMDSKVKKFLVDDHHKEFGGKYILNETMLLPPLEFTSPPNCNFFLPPMYNRVNWQYDIDGDVTRGYFKVTDTLSTKDSRDLKGMSVQVPNALFDIYTPDNKIKSKDKTKNSKKDEWGRVKPPVTLEERYKGVSTSYGSVEDLLARTDCDRSWPETTYRKEIAQKIREKEAELRSKIDETIDPIQKEVLQATLNKTSEKLASAEAKANVEAKRRIKSKGGGKSNIATKTALNRHAVLKFLNTKYAGRVAVVDMAFNPYPMSGFPGAIIVDDEAFGGESARTIIGMVQQVKHMITITPSGGDATTSIVLNNARFEDEPTDVDEFGNPLYMQSTESRNAEIDPDTGVYVKSYFTPDPVPITSKKLDNKYYDLDQNQEIEKYAYAKDVITLSKKDIVDGENNASYLDNDYMPNRIHKFYSEVFNHKKDHFMIGTDTIVEAGSSPRDIKFAYDTMHEAFVALRTEKKFLLTNYEECLKFIHRDICNADAFFQGILGCSVKQDVLDNRGKKTGDEFVVNLKNYNPESIHESYFGITTEDYESSDAVSGLKSPGGLMTKAGQFSSIREHLPLTAFIQEKRDAVVDYLAKIEQRVEGAQFANIEQYPENE